MEYVALVILIVLIEYIVFGSLSDVPERNITVLHQLYPEIPCSSGIIVCT